MHSYVDKKFILVKSGCYTGPTRTSSLAVLLSLAAEMIEDHVDAMATNGVCWGTQLASAIVVSHFPELEADQELLGFECNTDMIED
jgi:hypothetical protein